MPDVVTKNISGIKTGAEAPLAIMSEPLSYSLGSH